MRLENAKGYERDIITASHFIICMLIPRGKKCEIIRLNQKIKRDDFFVKELSITKRQTVYYFTMETMNGQKYFKREILTIQKIIYGRGLQFSLQSLSWQSKGKSKLSIINRALFPVRLEGPFHLWRNA
jgi:hypothetical protein